MGTHVVNVQPYKGSTGASKAQRSEFREHHVFSPGRLGCPRVPTAASVELRVQFVLLTELVGERDAGEKLAPLTADRVEVEEYHQASQQAQEDRLEDDDLAALAVQVKLAKADVRQEGKGKEKATDEA